MTISANEVANMVSFLDIGENDKYYLQRFWQRGADELPKVFDAFYEHVGKWPQLAEMLENKIDNLKKLQFSHWEQLFSAKFDAAYLERVVNVGEVHARIGLSQSWYMGAYSFLQTRLFELACRLDRLRPGHAHATVIALSKAITLDMDIALSVYHKREQERREERARERARLTAEFDQEVKSFLAKLSERSDDLLGQAESLEGQACQTETDTGTIAASAEQAAGNVQTVASAAEELSNSVEQILKRMGETQRTTERAVARMEETSQTVSTLQNSASTIDEVVQLINDIASQTNLLALNATIEAARAGEAGKGFAVVANEVKNLAAQTGQATDRIASQVRAVQEETGNAVSAISEVQQLIQEINSYAESSQSALEEQRSATNDIARNIEHASQGTREVSDGTRSLATVASENNKVANQVLTVARSLSGDADQLRQRVESFLAQVQA